MRARNRVVAVAAVLVGLLVGFTPTAGVAVPNGAGGRTAVVANDDFACPFC